jgi:hypothetical protein
MAIGTAYVYHGVETAGNSETMRCLTLAYKTFSHESGAASHTEVTKAEKDLPYTSNGIDGYIVTFYQVSGDTTISEASTLAQIGTAAKVAIELKYGNIIGEQ